jgi:serine O-acetyltransferase
MLRHSSCRQAMTGIETTTEQTPFRPSSATAGDLLWMRVREEARHVLATDPALATLFLASVLNRPSFEDAIIHRVASRLGNDVVPAALIADGLTSAVASDASIGEVFRADIAAVVDRDPACRRFIEPLLYSKGFHAIQAHRLANWLWKIGRSDFALYLLSRSSEVFQTDIHPAVPFGKGIFIDHATGLVIGATAVLGDDISLLQEVTLGGTGKEAGDRHPKIRHGVLIGAGAKVLGNIEIGSCARIAAGSAVLHPVSSNSTVAGVPARVVGEAGSVELRAAWTRFSPISPTPRLTIRFEPSCVRCSSRPSHEVIESFFRGGSGGRRAMRAGVGFSEALIDPANCGERRRILVVLFPEDAIGRIPVRESHALDRFHKIRTDACQKHGDGRRLGIAQKVLHQPQHDGTYAVASCAQLQPKADGSRRPLGIPTFEDKLAQRAIVMVLEAVYEQDFLPCSYGFAR